MAVTATDVLGVLVVRCGGMLAAAGLDGSAASPTLADALATSARDTGLPLASPLVVSDADLSGLSCGSDVSRLIDVAELRALESALNGLTRPDQRVQMGEKKWGSLRAEIEASIARRAKYIEHRYNIGMGTITEGFVPLHINEPACPPDEGWPW